MTPGAPSTEEVWNHHIDAWTQRNLDEIVADYDDQSVIVLNDKVFRGKAEIRGLFEDLLVAFDRATFHEIDPAIIEGNLVYIVWRTTIDGVDHPLGTDTFVIESGVIRYQTITADAAFAAHL
jgi:hypothetical protein